MNISSVLTPRHVARPSDEFRPDCDTCGGTGVIYQHEDYVVAGRKMGEWDVQYPCPLCGGKYCPTCLNSGTVRYELPTTHPDFGRLFACPDCPKGLEMAVRMQREALRDAELPEVYKHLTFETWDALPDVLKAGKELARAAAGLFVEQGIVLKSEIYNVCGRTFEGDDDARRSLVFQGAVGVGKTGLAAAIVNYLVVRHKPVLYIRARDAIGSIQARYGKEDWPSSEDVLDRFKRAPVLILDEMNLAKQSEDRIDHMETIVRYRHNNALPTIFTLNSDRDELESEWGLRTATVLRAMAHWIPVEGEPLRYEGEVLR